MRIAIIVAQTSKGLSTVMLSTDLDSARARFREIRSLGSLQVDGEDALCAWYFDTSGRQLRKFLAPESDVNAVDSANGAELSRRAASEKARARAQSELASSRKAHDLANAALDVLVQRITGTSTAPAAEPAVDDQPADELAASDDPFTEVAPKSPRPPKKK